jgi:hypothetical protein
VEEEHDRGRVEADYGYQSRNVPAEIPQPAHAIFRMALPGACARMGVSRRESASDLFRISSSPPELVGTDGQYPHRCGYGDRVFWKQVEAERGSAGRQRRTMHCPTPETRSGVAPMRASEGSCGMELPAGAEQQIPPLHFVSIGMTTSFVAASLRRDSPTLRFA